MQNYSGLSLRRVVCAAGAGLLLLLGSPSGPRAASQPVHTAQMSEVSPNRVVSDHKIVKPLTAPTRLVSLNSKLRRARSSHSTL